MMVPPAFLKDPLRVFAAGLLAAALTTFALSPGSTRAQDREVVNEVEVDDVWSGHPVGFDLVEKDGHIFIGYYRPEEGGDRRMTIAHREPGSSSFTYTELPTSVGWDSHNYIEMAIGPEGYLHVSGNMHVDPLIYFRSTVTYDAESLVRVPTMVDPRTEDEVTYPEFFENKDGRLLFEYRDGESGDGQQIFNIYNAQAQDWDRLLDDPFTDGEGERNAYLDGPVLGADGRWHIAWVWRENSDVDTNHDLSYAVSDDLVNWETSTGRDLSLPITLGEAQKVDPVPQNNGLVNGITKVGFDNQGRQTITYHKYDENGNSQVYVARAEEGGAWQIYQITDWDGYRWEFGGAGSIDFDVGVGRLKPTGEAGRVEVYVRRRGDDIQNESSVYILDEETLEKVDERPRQGLPQGVQRTPEVQAQQGDDELQMRYLYESAGEDLFDPDANEGQRYLISWATLPSNRDRPRDFIPPPTSLKLYETQEVQDQQPPPAGIDEGTPAFAAASSDGDALFTSFEDGGFVGYGSLDYGGRTVPVGEQPGTVMLWLPEASAFRAGGFTKSGRLAPNIGPYSFAGGQNTRASGYGSTAFGSGSQALGRGAAAIGQDLRADSDASMTIGSFNDANRSGDGQNAFVVGNGDNEGGVTLSDALVLKKNGDLTIAGSLTENSDARIKTNVGPLSKEGRVMEKLATVTPVRYQFEEGTGHPSGEQVGVLAQEIEAVFPSLVTEGPSGMLSVSYTKLAAVLLEGVNEQQARVERRAERIKRERAEIERRQEQIDALEARLEALEDESQEE